MCILFKGSGLGSFGGPVVIQVLLDTYGLSGAIFIVGALTANYFLCTALFIPALKVGLTKKLAGTWRTACLILYFASLIKRGNLFT